MIYKTLGLTDFLRSCLACKYINRHSQIEILVNENNQFVVKSESFIIFSCDLPFKSIQEMKIERLCFDCVVILISSKQQAGVISFQQRKLLQWWDKVEDIFIDDFLNVGHDQIVVVVLTNQSETNYIITDFKCCDVNMQNKKITQIDHKSESELCYGYKSASRAVENKVKAAELYINDLQSRVDEKKDFLESCCCTLKHLTCGMDRSKSSSNCNYVNLLSHDLQSIKTNDDSKTEQDCFHVLKISKVICEEHLLVSLNLQNKSSRMFCNLSLSILNNINLTCHSMVYFPRIKENYLMFIDKSKHIKVDLSNKYFTKNDTLILDVSVYLPTLQLDDDILFLMIHYSVVDDDKYFSVCVGHIVITGEDIISGKLNSTVEEMDIHLQNSYYTHCNIQNSFTLTSDLTDLNIFPSLLSKLFHIGTMTYHFFGHMTLLNLPHIKVHIRLKTASTTCPCTIYTKSKELFVIVLKEIEKVLPGDVSMGLKVNNNNNNDNSTCVHYLHNELKVTLNTLKVLLNNMNINQNVVVIDDVPLSKKRKRTESMVSGTNAMIYAILKTNRCMIEIFQS